MSSEEFQTGTPTRTSPLDAATIQRQAALILEWEQRYRALAIRTNQLEHLIGEIAMLLRNTSASGGRG